MGSPSRGLLWELACCRVNSKLPPERWREVREGFFKLNRRQVSGAIVLPEPAQSFVRRMGKGSNLGHRQLERAATRIRLRTLFQITPGFDLRVEAVQVLFTRCPALL